MSKANFIKRFKGLVQLDGFVDSAQAFARAVVLSISVNGIKNVKNNLIVK